MVFNPEKLLDREQCRLEGRIVEAAIEYVSMPSSTAQGAEQYKQLREAVFAYKKFMGIYVEGYRETDS